MFAYVVAEWNQRHGGLKTKIVTRKYKHKLHETSVVETYNHFAIISWSYYNNWFSFWADFMLLKSHFNLKKSKLPAFFGPIRVQL